MRRNCPVKESANRKILGDLYGPWIKAEAEAALLIRERGNLRRVENMKNEHFDNFSKDINTDEINGEEDGQIGSDGEEDGEENEGDDLGSNPKIVSESSGLSNHQT